MNLPGLRVLLRGGGDLGSGVAIRLFRAGANILICELDKPLVVRRTVSFAEAVYTSRLMVEEVEACLAHSHEEIVETLKNRKIAVIVDPGAEAVAWYKPHVVVDCRLMKIPPEQAFAGVKLVVGLGPGFEAGVNCDAVIETRRGSTLGRVLWQGTAEQDTHVPEGVKGYVEERVLRAPREGYFLARTKIGDIVTSGQVIAEVSGVEITSKFEGIVRGLVADNLWVPRGLKVGDIDPRKEPGLCDLVSDKSLAIGGGVVEAVLHYECLRALLGGCADEDI